LPDFEPGRRLIDWAQDVDQLADRLGVGEFYLSGLSAGGPHALACAHQLPDRVIAGAVISSVAPMSRPRAYQGMPAPNQLLAGSSSQYPSTARLIRWLMRFMLTRNPEKAMRRLMSSIPETDKAILYDPGNVEIVMSSIQEGFRQGSRGVAQDDTLTNRDWGFDLGEVQPRIDIWHGDADVTVPIHAGKHLHNTLPNTRATFFPGEGHFLLLSRWEQVLSGLVDGE